MKLYFSPGACSLSPHIVLREAGYKFDAETVDLRTHKTKSGQDFYAINPKGYVPALILDDGELLTEGSAIVQYLADKRPRRKLAGKAGTMERYHLQEWLNYIVSEIHKSFSPLFNPAIPDEIKQIYRDRLKNRFNFVANSLGQKPYLMGADFSVADAYLYTMLTWAQGLHVEVGPTLDAYRERVAARPAVKAALKAEAKAKAA